jgi:unsaturated rhamnogalacturonyl hydrolase
MARMPRLVGYLFACGIGLALRITAAQEPIETTLDSGEIIDTLARVGDWQLENPSKFDPRSWVIAPLYDGLIDASLMTGDPRYLAAVVHAGRRIDYELGSRMYHADGQAAGHAWLRIYELGGGNRPSVLRRAVEQFDEIVKNPVTAQLKFGEPPPEDLHVTDRWTWADSLYMAPPTIGLLAQITGNERYLQFVDAEYRFAYDALYDKREHLFYRDARYIGQRTPNGEKVFWSRGNGWVLAGLALFMDTLPADYANRAFYEGLFHELSAAIVDAQQPGGYWYPSLQDPRHVAIPETSGGALFVLALAWGVRNNVLDADTYWPSIERGWRAIEAKIDSSGAVRSVQPPAREPEPFNSGSTVPYGTGAVLMAGAEIVRALGAAPSTDATQLLADAEKLVADAPDLSTSCRQPCDRPNPEAPSDLRAQ